MSKIKRALKISGDKLNTNTVGVHYATFLRDSKGCIKHKLFRRMG